MSARSEAWALALEGIQDLEEEMIRALRRSGDQCTWQVGQIALGSL